LKRGDIWCVDLNNEDRHMTELPTSRRLIPWPIVKDRVGNISKPTAWRAWRRGEFPKPVKLTAHRIAWFEDEIDKWIDSRTTATAA
jgi:predicted DNA-binding transcriptional regulator AlpA